ncbi:aspartic proteinase nepenthesin-1 isoform X1 [Physcomitrium patens]|uniref:Peptidase A1 domain-containing protein n=1 Tax=Physcomitrium patens TaxID=3218 RepID=A0A2K1ICD9_PHYPA|nr:aspartic proteinase nepenthesin-1-like isoform X1 [Physcomitrium patens]PNR26941.1 hypothetical protein PHYPA_030422 [Physcomitrium patens]|eukprot:XP_024366674.1 aspartic proteinase nepenthesin-1-like isoform X1 [Physcomitrella patens]
MGRHLGLPVLLVVLAILLFVQFAVAADEGFGRHFNYFETASFPHRVDGAVVATTFGDPAKAQAFTVNLLRRDQHEKLAGVSGKSWQQSFTEAVQRSHERVAFYTLKLSPDAFGSQEFQSPVKAGNGEYLMTLTLGSPPQSFDVIVDTGSDLNWVQCLPCRVCYQQPGPKFDPSKSRSFRKAACTDNLCNALPLKACAANVCQYQYTYGDQSNTNGDLAFETISLNNGAGTQSVPNFAFGCGTQNLGTFAGAAGLVGLGQGPLSLNSQLSHTFANKFSYCLVSLNSLSASPLTFGSIAAAANIQYTSIVVNARHPTYYYVQLNSIEVGGQPLNLAPSVFAIDQSTGRGGTIIDSGTTITMLTLPAYSAVLRAYESFVNYPRLDGSAYGLDLCFNIAGVSNPSVPDMVFKFQGADFQMRGENLFVLVDTSATTLCLAMGGSQGFSIIGNIQQQNHLVVYDLEAKKIGFATADC